MKKILAILMCSVMLFTGTGVSAIEISSDAACVLDFKTGEFYYEYNADTMLAPASMTKLMTVYMIYSAMGEGKLTGDTMITADAEDEAASVDPDATNVFLQNGTAYSVNDLLDAILVPSACAASAMAGKYLCGSEREFARKMNETAAQLGLNAYFEDASGLSDANRITARSTALLAKMLIEKYPDILTHTSKPYIIFGTKRYNSTNHMLPGDSYAYTGVDGLKTGTTTLAGYCLTATAESDGIRLISVTMKSDTSRLRFLDSTQLLDFGFNAAHWLYDNLLATDMRVFINGNEIPAFRYAGPGNALCIMAEDLKDYGFDLSWNDGTRTLTAVYGEQRKVSPIPMDMYRGYVKDTALFHVYRDSKINIKLNMGGNEYSFTNTFPLDGYTAISADELAGMAKSSTWNGNERALYIEL